MLADDLPIRPEVEQRTVEGAAGELTVPFDDADRQVDASLPRGLAQPLGGRTGDHHGVLPVTLPQRAARRRAAAHHHAETEASRIGRHERFREQHELRASRSRLSD